MDGQLNAKRQAYKAKAGKTKPGANSIATVTATNPRIAHSAARRTVRSGDQKTLILAAGKASNTVGTPANKAKVVALYDD
jgi:hypothetical protein